MPKWLTPELSARADKSFDENANQTEGELASALNIPVTRARYLKTLRRKANGGGKKTPGQKKNGAADGVQRAIEALEVERDRAAIRCEELEKAITSLRTLEGAQK